jgi:hypothetical protein
MNDENRRILALANDCPLIGIGAVRAGQIADECISLRGACDAATQRFSASDATQFAAIFTAPVNGARPQ